MNITIEHIRISLGAKFQLKETILIFETNLSKYDISGLKQKKRTSHVIQQIQISLNTKFLLKQESSKTKIIEEG